MRILFAAAAAIVLGGTPALASISYNVLIDTSSISGTAGSVDFFFAPGISSQFATATILNFAPSANLGSEVQSGGVTGTLPPLITLSNTAQFNDDFVLFTFANSLSFVLTLDGPAITAPDHVATSGSSFGFSMLNAAGDTPFLTTSPGGFAFTVDINLNGTTTLTNFVTSPNTISLVTPEPSSIGLAVLGLGALAGMRRLRNKRTRA